MSWASRGVVSVLVLMGALSAHAQADAGDAPPSNDEIGRAEFLRGRHAYDAGDYATALDAFQRALELTQRPTLHYNVGLAHDRLRHDEQALQSYRLFLELVPEAPERAQVEGRVSALEAAERRRQEEADRRREEELARQAELERLRREREEEGGGLWWIGVVAGAVAAAAVVTTVVLVTRDDGGVPQGDFGPATQALVQW